MGERNGDDRGASADTDGYDEVERSGGSKEVRMRNQPKDDDRKTPKREAKQDANRQTLQSRPEKPPHPRPKTDPSIRQTVPLRSLEDKANEHPPVVAHALLLARRAVDALFEVVRVGVDRRGLVVERRGGGR
jgi:hypothetical protein